MSIVRHTNPNGTYRYEIDGKVAYKASKVLYTHASTYSVNDHAVGMTHPTLFHKTENAANKATGYRSSGWVKTGVQVIEDGDAPTPDTSTVLSVKTADLTYHGRRARVTTTKHERSNTGLRTVEYVWLDDAHPVNGGHPAGTRVVKVMHGSGIPGAKVAHVLHSCEIFPPN